jgi:carboxylesterase
MGTKIPLIKNRVFWATGIVLSLFLLLRIPEFRAQPNPATSFEEAVQKFEALRLEEFQLPLRPEGASRFLQHGHKTERAFVLLHGLTNCPEQFVPLAKILHASGANVIIPRARYAGFADRLNNLQGEQSGQDLIAGAWMAQHRDGIDQMILIAPFFSLDAVPAPVIDTAAAIVSRLPNFYQWWDSSQKENLKGPNYAYPRFGTRCMADTIQLSRHVRAHLKTHPLKVGRLDFLLTASDTAANNALTKSLAESLSQSNTAPVRVYEFPATLGIPHDMIDPAQPNAKTKISYAKILELLEVGHPETRP